MVKNNFYPYNTSHFQHTPISLFSHMNIAPLPLKMLKKRTFTFYFFFFLFLSTDILILTNSELRKKEAVNHGKSEVFFVIYLPCLYKIILNKNRKLR